MQNIILTLTLLICFSSYSQIAPPIPPKIPNNGSKFLECFCKENNFVIVKSSITSDSLVDNLMIKMLPNLFGKVALFRIK